MPVKVAVLKETRPGERRVALVPSVVPKFEKLGAEMNLQSGAGAGIRQPDGAYKGVTLIANPQGMVSGAEVVLSVQPPALEVIDQMREGTVLVCFVYAHREADFVRRLCARKITCFAMELVPRITRAQAMDALSSQAALVGYYGALMGATELARIYPMITTAVGSIRPAKVLVMGAGVAGLQAIATARRLGAMVEGYDVRSATKEQVESLGAKFVDTGVKAEGQGGYARELTAEEKAQAAEVLTRHIQAADVIITTAAIPGRPSPKLISKAQVDGMKNGAVIIDLAAEGGGNCEYSQPGETVQIGAVTIAAPLNVASRLAEHASELYSKNQYNLLELFLKQGELKIDWQDEILSGAVLTHAGEIRNEAARKAVDGT